MNPAHAQRDYRIRFEWGLSGAQAIAPGADLAVVVDVLSFTTTLSVAVDAGIEVYPQRFRDESASALADSVGATLAVGRSEAGHGAISLSPNTVRRAHGIQRLVLPSPNGATISATLADLRIPVVGACLRNHSAVADWITSSYDSGTVIAVIAAGEKWGDGTLRPAAEDLWGAGAVLSHLPFAEASPETRVAASAWEAVRDSLSRALSDCASGRELIDAGYPEDVSVAAEVDASRSVPIMSNGSFMHAAPRSRITENHS